MGTESRVRPHLIPAVIAVLMLLAALGHWPYGYYQFLRLVVCGTGLYVAWLLAYSSKYPWTAWFFVPIAILFNPLVPVHLSRDTWQLIDPICAVVFLLACIVAKAPGTDV
jgi:uncharacterized membrane protein YccC